MTPQQISQDLADIRKSVGPKCYISMHIHAGDRKPVSVSLYPYGMERNDGYLFKRSESFDGAIADLRAAWSEYQASYEKEMTRKIALAIIRITDEFGHCSDAALRQKFDAGQIASFGDAACELADTMAAKGPFGIVAVAGANAAAS